MGNKPVGCLCQQLVRELLEQILCGEYDLITLVLEDTEAHTQRRGGNWECEVDSLGVSITERKAQKLNSF